MAATRGSEALSNATRNNRSLRRKLVGACDVSEQTVRNWEGGEHPPKDKYRPTIESAAGVPRAWWDEPAAVLAPTGTDGR